MKNTLKLIALAMLMTIGFTSCEDDEKQTLIPTAELDNGGFLRTTAVIQNELALGDDEAFFSVELEEVDAQNGGLLGTVDVFVTFTDGSPDAGDTSNANFDETLYTTVPASAFAPGPNGLLRYTLRIPVQDFLDIANLSQSQIFGGDVFQTRLVLNLTDGSSFSESNTAADIRGGAAYNSPFLYRTPVVCPVMDTEFVGDYMATTPSPGIFGADVFKQGNIFTFTAGDTSVDRSFMYIYLEDFGIGNGPVPFSMQFVCDNIVVPNGQRTGLACSAIGLALGAPINAPLGTYITGDDSTFQINLADNINGDCGAGPADTSSVMVKQ